MRWLLQNAAEHTPRLLSSCMSGWSKPMLSLVLLSGTKDPVVRQAVFIFHGLDIKGIWETTRPIFSSGNVVILWPKNGLITNQSPTSPNPLFKADISWTNIFIPYKPASISNTHLRPFQAAHINLPECWDLHQIRQLWANGLKLLMH